MAITATDNKLRFLSGTSTALAGVAVTPGNVYVTTDEHVMYADIGSKRLRLSDIVMVDTQADLPTYPPEEKQTALYYIRNSNILCCYNKVKDSNGTGTWTQINSAPTLETIIKSSAVAYSEVSDGITAKAKFTLKDKADTDVTPNFTLLISSGQTATVAVNADSTNGIVVTAADTITDNDLSVSAASNKATITLSETKSGYNADGTAKTAAIEDHKIYLNNNGGLTITASGDQINLKATPTKITNAFDANGAFTTKITMPDTDEVTSTSITPSIKIGVGSVKATAEFKNGVASFTDVYTKTEVDNEIKAKLNAANAMVFKGSVGGTTNLPVANSGVAIGDTYIVKTAGAIKNTDGTTVQASAKVGDLFIANASASDETDGKITKNLEWVYVPAGNDDLYSYTAAASNTGIVLSEKYGSETEAMMTINIGTGLAGAGSGNTLTISHPDVTVSDNPNATANLSTGATQTFAAISGVTRDSRGHVTGVTTTTYSVANHSISKVSYAATASTDTAHKSTATVTGTVKQTSGAEESGSFILESSSLKATASSNKVTVDLVWYEF